jgi:hypothetical protein
MNKIYTSIQYVLMSLFMCQLSYGALPIIPIEIEIQETIITSIPGSMSPYLKTNTSGITTLNWLEPTSNGYALIFSQYKRTWGENKLIASGDNWFINWADFPSITHINDGNYAAHLLIRSGSERYAYDTHISLSKDSGDTWSKSTLINLDGTPTEHGFVSLYKDKNDLGVIYLDGRKMINEMTDDPNDTGMTLRALSINNDQDIISEQLIDGLVCECCQTDIALSNKGPIGIYRNRDENEIRDIYVTQKIDAKWTKGKPVYNDNWKISGCPVNGPSIHAVNNEITIGWFTAAENSPVIKIAKSFDDAISFEKPVLIGLNNAVGHLNITVDAYNNTWVIWHKKLTSGSVAVMLSKLNYKEKYIHEMIIDDTGSVPRYSVPQIAYHDNEIIIAWTYRKISDANTRGENRETFIKTATLNSKEL